ncbi:hypothetical protein KEM60_01491 [Austwickia sp. TVS 96-490-7B]|uniref:hypothetical protein n=1 Tax=Austwickia sp. TVS 96-490-7B TaxID=2830843 RepID=UPI001C593B57|nr:hypothetical protein [Austwickia sp. TVS 96-490-7B]MBW3085294.1 hypothetical protein [Austwickia sp. TVS 96-490-7B]
MRLMMTTISGIACTAAVTGVLTFGVSTSATADQVERRQPTRWPAGITTVTAVTGPAYAPHAQDCDNAGPGYAPDDGHTEHPGTAYAPRARTTAAAGPVYAPRR